MWIIPFLLLLLLLLFLESFAFGLLPIFLSKLWNIYTTMCDLTCRLLQISSFNGKMNALNEVNKVLTNVSYYTNRHGQPSEEDEWLTAEKMAVSCGRISSL